MSAPASDSAEAKELSLVGKVELRIALADSDKKLESLLKIYLAPLLLKLSSDSVNVRNKVISICQHINTRIKPDSISLPVADLLKQLKDTSSNLVRHFDLLYIQQGLERIPQQARVELLPILIQDISKIINVSPAQGATLFNQILRVLPFLKLPPRGTKEDAELRSKLSIADEDASTLSFWLGRLILLIPLGTAVRTCAGLKPAEYTFLYGGSPPDQTWNPSSKSGLNLTETKVAALKLLASGAFTDKERFFPSVFALADPNSRLSDLGEYILKKFEPNLEDPEVIEPLMQTYFGSSGDDGALPARPTLQAKILGLFCKSKLATTHTSRVIRILDEGFFTASNSAQGLEATKLRGQIFSFVTWTARMGSAESLKQVAPKAVLEMKRFIQYQGWPHPLASGVRLSPADLNLRSLAYESIGVLAPKMLAKTDDMEGSLQEVRLDLLRWLFSSLACDGSGDQIFVSIEQALGSLLNAFSYDLDDSVQGSLRELLLQHMLSLKVMEDDPSTGYKVIRSTRFAALRFANRCLPYSDNYARWIDLLAVGGGLNERSEVIEEGKKGLDPYWYRMLNPRKEGSWVPSLSTEENEYPRYKFPGFEAFSSFIFDKSADKSTVARLKDCPQALGPAVAFSRNLLVGEAISAKDLAIQIEPDWNTKMEAIVNNKEEMRSAFRDHLSNVEVSSVVALIQSALDGLLWNEGQGMARCGDYLVEICSLSSNEILEALLEQVPRLDEVLFSNHRHSQALAAQVFGILASHPTFPLQARRDALISLVQKTASWKGAVGQEVCRIRGAILAAAYLSSRLTFRGLQDDVYSNTTKELMQTLVDILGNSRDSLLQETSYMALAQLSLAFGPEAGKSDLISNSDEVVRILLEGSKKENEKAIHAIGRFSISLPRQPEADAIYQKLLKGLFDLHEIKRPEVHFALGEALTIVAVGWDSKALLAEFDVDAQPLDLQVPSSNLEEVLERIITDCAASKPSLRKASAIWLLCMVQYCGHRSEVQARLRKCQVAFGRLLSDRDEVVQETGSRGLSLVYEMGDKGLKDELVRDLVRSFTDTKANISGTVNEETQLFEPGALPTGDGSVSTYKDIMSLASEVGDPSLVYRFMSLASNNAIWSTRAAFGRFGLSNVLSDSSVNGYLSENPKLYPKLYRYRFDPNPNVQRSMNDIWHALVKDPNALVDAQFDNIIQDLLQSILQGKEWRVRQACCAAIADLIQGRPIEKYDRYLNDILNKAFKVLDDIKETVRVAAMGLCKTLTNLVIRNLESGAANSKRSQAMLRHVIPFLLSTAGIESSAQETQAFAISTLLQIIKKAPASVLSPFAPQIIERLLGSLSSMEPQAVNYVHLNADKYGMTGQEIDNIRISSIKHSPLMEAIEGPLLESLDSESMADTASRLEETLRSAVGLPSKVGCSRVLVSLSTKPALFKPYADKFLRLLHKYVLDRNETISASYATAVGYVVRSASDTQIKKTLDYARNLYFTSDDGTQRAVSGEILYYTSKLASDKFAAFASSALPFVFIAQHDSDETVKDYFGKTWKENVGGTRAVSLYLKEILEIVATSLESPKWAIKHTAAFAVASMIESLDQEIDKIKALEIWPVLDMALNGKTWEGKERVLKAFVRFVKQSRSLQEADKVTSAKMKVSAKLFCGSVVAAALHY